MFVAALIVAVVAVIAVATAAVGGSLGRSNAATQNSGTAPPASLQSLTPSTQMTPRSTAPESTTAPATTTWRIAWGSGMALGYAPTGNATLRELIPVHQAGSQVKLRLSNAYGDKPLAIGAASVATSNGMAAGLVPGTLTPLTFGGQPSVVVPVGATTMTDAVALNVQAGETLAVSLFVAQPDLVTVHPCCKGPIVSYGTVNGEGNLTAATATAAFVYHSPWPAIVDALDVLQTGGNGSIVVVGDSITDGYHSTVRWTDVLQQRIDMLPVADQRAVVNEGITANTMTELPNDDSKKGGGEAGVARIQHDALTQPGVSTVVLLLGINDLWFGASSAQVIAGMKQVIADAHSAGVRIVGVTLLPRQTSPTEAWTPAQQAALMQVNAWILHSGAFDGVLDLGPVVADAYSGACVPTSMFPPYDSGDHLHPNATGETAMADAVDTTILGMPAAPQVPQPPVTPTPGCAVAGV